MERNISGGKIEFTVNNGGECALFVTLFSLGLVGTSLEFPEHVIILDPKLSETEETFSRILKRFNDLISHIKNKNVSSKGYETDFEDQDDCSNYEEFSYSNRNSLASAASRLALYSLRDTDRSETGDANIQHTHDYFVINPCKISLVLKPESIDQIQTLFTDFPTKDITLNNLKRHSILPSIDKRPTEQEVSKELNGNCLCLLEFIKEGKDLGVKCTDILKEFGDMIVDDINYLVDKQYVLRTGCAILRFVHYHFVKPWVVLSYCLPRSVKDSLATGSDKVQDIMEIASRSGCNEDDARPSTSTLSPIGKFDEDLQKSLNPKFTSEESFLDNEGKRKSSEDKTQPPEDTSEPRSKRLKSSAMVSKFSKVIESKSVKDVEIVVKPWIRVDGSVNRRVLDRMLGSVLAQISFMPGTSLEKLQNRFSPAIQPAQTHELVLMLNDLGCINMFKIGEMPICSLFSARSKVEIIPATGLEDSQSFFLEPTPTAIIKLGLFIGDKTYTGIYMDLEHFAIS